MSKTCQEITALQARRNMLREDVVWTFTVVNDDDEEVDVDCDVAVLLGNHIPGQRDSWDEPGYGDYFEDVLVFANIPGLPAGVDIGSDHPDYEAIVEVATEQALQDI